jgi:hypothetical protein
LGRPQSKIDSLAHFLKYSEFLQAHVIRHLQLGLTFLIDNCFGKIAGRGRRDNVLVGGLLLIFFSLSLALLLMETNGQIWRYLVGIGVFVVLAWLAVVLANEI